MNKRLVSLDVMRGIMVLMMILVNNGAGPATFHQLQHSRWNGLTVCDIVFSFFLFIMGISTFLSLTKYHFRCSQRVMSKIARRTLLLFILGLFINWFDKACHGNLLPCESLRYWGVLQRIALCYLAVSLVALFVSRRLLIPLIVALLTLYAVIIVAADGYAYDANNILAHVDRTLFGNGHLYQKSPVDPEGLLSTIPAIALTLIGFLLAQLMSLKTTSAQKIRLSAITGTTLLLLGLALQPWLPLNKRICSPSYVLLSCGLASLLLACLMTVIDAGRRKRKPTLFLVFGMNPLFLYVLSELLAIVFDTVGLNDAIYRVWAEVITAPKWASLAYAITFTMLNFMAGYILYRRRVFIKL